MLLAVVDDLLFSSKIRAAADQAGRTVGFVRTRGAVLSEIRANDPDLIIFDLDREAVDSIAAIREIRTHADVRHVRIVGFVSHVRAEVIEAARTAGADLVLARSAFVAKLPELIAATSDRPAQPL